MLLFEIRDSDKIDILKAIFINMKTFTETMSVHIDSEKMMIQGMDKTHVLLHDFEFTGDWFDKYNVKEPIEFCLNTEEMVNAFNIDFKNKYINVFCDGVDSEAIEFIYYDEDDDNDIPSRKYKAAKIVNDFEQMNIPEVSYDCIINISVKKLKVSLNDLSKTGKNVIFNCFEQYCSLSSSQCTINIKKKDVQNYTLNSEPFNLAFSLEFLQNICKVEKISDNVDIKLSTTTPLLFQYNICEQLKIKFYLAPYEDENE